MKTLHVLACLLFLPATFLAGDAAADQKRNLSLQQMEQLVHEVTTAQNKATTRGATLADVEHLYAMYTADFVYEHPMMGDAYTREHLYANHIRALEQGRYEKVDPASHGYRIVAAMYGDDAATVQRSQVRRGDAPPRMTVFEFQDSKVARIREYWNY